jgi:hypothetical protein
VTGNLAGDTGTAGVVDGADDVVVRVTSAERRDVVANLAISVVNVTLIDNYFAISIRGAVFINI